MLRGGLVVRSEVEPGEGPLVGEPGRAEQGADRPIQGCPEGSQAGAEQSFPAPVSEAALQQAKAEHRAELRTRPGYR
jgi:hypothetical protein